MIRFLSPWWLLLVLPVLATAGAYVWTQLRGKVAGVRFSNVDLLTRLVPKTPGWRRHLTATRVFLLVLLAMATGMAKPSVDVKVPLERATIMLAIDVSLSMKATDVTPNRIVAAQQAAKLFVKELPANYNLGLVAFAKTAEVKVSPGKDRGVVLAAIDALQLQESTAIGEAIFTCLDAIASVPADGASGAPPARIVLMSDGYTTYGRPNAQAAAAAKKARVPVSTIAFGTLDGTVELSGQQVSVPVDRDALQKVATQTDGRYYEAASSDALKSAYADLGSSVGYHTPNPRKSPSGTQVWLCCVDSRPPR
ncbi:VWA domain-containing protein [Fodinicola feengrottensis]|uniref:VWA domain-containing protein n=1 Tax=Fodinicola feengrottensis TaxID=435914 RepID=UPI002443293A|nr:VWA domain-containing protein [Fodinicola feengrottensis]